jgi:phosphoribosyl-AMP cyclohydrolase
VAEVYFDCDGDTILLKVDQIGGAACHEGYKSCFFRRVHPVSGTVTIEGKRLFDPAEVYGRK